MRRNDYAQHMVGVMSGRDVDEAKIALEVRMAEIAALLDDVADALTNYPDEIVIGDQADATLPDGRKGAVRVPVELWPSVQDLEQLLANWRSLVGPPPRSGGRPRAA